MIKFVIVDKAPDEVSEGEFVLSKPKFLEEIKANASKAGKNKLTGSTQLRYIVDSIGMKYDPSGTNAWSVKTHLFEGRAYSSDEELSKIIVEMLEQCHPSVFKKYVEFTLDHLPTGTDKIFFEDFKVLGTTTPLFERGFQLIVEKSNRQTKVFSLNDDA